MAGGAAEATIDLSQHRLEELAPGAIDLLELNRNAAVGVVGPGVQKLLQPFLLAHGHRAIQEMAVSDGAFYSDEFVAMPAR